LDDLEVSHGEDGTTTLTGLVQDQAQLHGLLAKIRDLGVTLIQVDVCRSQSTSPCHCCVPQQSYDP
jgi:hypothetical protein